MIQKIRIVYKLYIDSEVEYTQLGEEGTNKMCYISSSQYGISGVPIQVSRTLNLDNISCSNTAIDANSLYRVTNKDKGND